MPTVSRAAVQTTPARPSISPLSSAAKSIASSPIITRDAITKQTAMPEDEEADNTSEPGDAEIGEQHDDQSSSLSDLDHDGVDDEAIDEDEPDSEAETERLDQTPQKLRKTTDQLKGSRLNQGTIAAEEFSEPPSPSAVGAGAASSTSTVATVGQKRKRDETASPLTSADSDLGESPRKRTHEMPVEALEEEDDALEQVEPSTEIAERKEDTPAPDDTHEPQAIPTKGFKGRRGGRKKKYKEPVDQPVFRGTEDLGEPEEEPSEEKEARTEEEIKAKKEATNAYNELKNTFRMFREKLNGEQLAALSKELEMLDRSNVVHPEFLKQVACVDARLQKQKNEAQAFYKYRLSCIRERTLGERSQLHSQYYQSVREMREDVLYKLGEDWHAIQKERRQSHQEQDDLHIYRFPTDKKVQKRIQAKYNQEVSVLSGMAKWVGFPAAPTINGVDGDSFENDMKAMKISKRVHQSVAPPRPAFYAGPSLSEQNERLAHERFIEQNPWARPQAPIHAHGTPGISHTPDWAEQPSTVGHGSSKHLIRNLSSQIHRIASPYATPLTQKRPLVDPNSSAGTLPLNSDGPEPPSSVVAAPPTTGRIELMNQASSNQSSPFTFPKSRQLGQNGTELTGFRNVSGISAISGASTIEAPPETDHQRERQSEAAKMGLPSLLQTSSASHSVFDTSQLHRHPRDEMREVYPNAGFRPQEGAFGTPAPLPPGDGRP